MFIISLCYKKELSEVDKYIDAHVEFLEKYYALGVFIASGRKVPRIGGVILANTVNKEEVNVILTEDPFYIADVADYEVIEFVPTKFVDSFKPLIA